MDHAGYEAMMAQGEMLLKGALQALSVAPYVTTPDLVALLLHISDEGDEARVELLSNPHYLSSAGYFQLMNGVGVPGVEEFHFEHTARQQFHEELRGTNHDDFCRLHYCLYQLACGEHQKTGKVILPHYLRTLVGQAYHGGFVREQAGIEHYGLLLGAYQRHQIKPGLFWEAGRLVREQKGFGLFAGEPVTDEIVEITGRL